MKPKPSGMISSIPLAVTPLSRSFMTASLLSEGLFSVLFSTGLFSATGLFSGSFLVSPEAAASFSFSSSSTMALITSSFFMLEVPLIPLLFAIALRSTSASVSYFSLI